MQGSLAGVTQMSLDSGRATSSPPRHMLLVSQPENKGALEKSKLSKRNIFISLNSKSALRKQCTVLKYEGTREWLSDLFIAHCL